MRTCSVSGTALALVPPFGFTVNDRWLKRSGLDYWKKAQIEIVEDLEKALDKTKQTFYFFSSRVRKHYTQLTFDTGSWLIFGSETTGLPERFFQKWSDRFASIPMLPQSRCLNLATSAGIVLYEALRQQDFRQLTKE